MKSFLASLAASSLLTSVLAVATAAPAPRVEAISLSGPEVVKLDWMTRALQAVDINGDGLQDLALINNDKARIDFLFQVKPGENAGKTARSVTGDRWEPVLEDARFRKESLVTGITMSDLMMGDLNGDGRADIAYTGDPEALTIRLQKADGTWSEKTVFELGTPVVFGASMRVDDLNGDKRTDLVLLTQKELVILLQTSKGELATPVRMPLITENCYGLEVLDINNDKLPDLLYMAPDSRDAMRVRLQTGRGQFGPEQAYVIEPARSTMQILPTGPGQTPQLAYIQNQTGQLSILALEPGTGKEARSLRPKVFSPRVNSKAPAAYAFGDLDGDGIDDLTVSDADGAQLFVYLRQADGSFSHPSRYPSLADGRFLASIDWDGDKRAELFVASAKEQVVGMARLEKADQRVSYPQPIALKGKPIAITAGVMKKQGPATLVVCAKDDAGKRSIEFWVRDVTGPKLDRSVDLGAVKSDPKGLRLLDVNQDGLMDVLVFVAFEPVRLYVQAADGTYAEATAATGFRKGLVDNIDSSAITQFDITGDGLPEMVLGGSGFARALRMSDKGELAVVDQYNARDTMSEVAAALLVPGDKNGAEMLLLDKKTDTFQMLRKDERGVFQFHESVPAGKIDLVGAEMRAGPKGKPELFFYGKDRFWWVSPEEKNYVARVVKTHATDLREVNYSDVVAGDLNADGCLDLVCNDPEHNVIEILSLDKAGEWQSRTHFKVFEQDAHFRGRKGAPQEPRETVIADVTGDGKKDLILLVHDRVLVYPQD